MNFCLRLLAISLAVSVHVFSQNIVINEVMFDLAGVDYHDEFVEIINLDTQAVDLSGYAVGDQDESDGLIVPPDRENIIIFPGEYMLILDGSYIENSTTFDSLLATGLKYALINDSSFGKSGFSNSVPETVILVNNMGDTLDKYQYSLDNDPGFSDEKILPGGPCIIENWANSSIFLGTPGEKNSVSNDQPLVVVRAFKVEQQESIIKVNLSALGLIEEEEIFSLHVWIDKDFDGHLSTNDVTLADSVLSMRPFLLVETEWHKAINEYGTLDIWARIYNSETSVKQLETIFWKSVDPIRISLNEIMFTPLEDEPEWIELYNHHPDPIRLSDIRLTVNSDTLDLSNENSVIYGHDYLVLSEAAYLPARFDAQNDKIMHLQNWENLRITEENMRLIDPFYHTIDSLIYTSAWWDGDLNNRSLEKKSEELGNNIGSWGICRYDVGGSPGEKNSWISGETVHSSGHLELNSLYFSPEALDAPNFLEVATEGPGDGIITMKIFDLRGRIVKILALDQFIAGKEYFIWDGLNENSQLMPTGTYIIYSAFKGNLGNWTEKKAISLYWGK